MARAYLGNKGEYTTFTFENRTITFLTGKNLERYESIKEWDNGYLVVMAKNKGKAAHEDYIDLTSIVKNLYMKPEIFFKPITEVVIQNV